MDPENLLKLTKIVLGLKTKVKCPICLDFIENTVELKCSHRFCSSCLQDLRSQNSPSCPVCKVSINKRAALHKDQFLDDLSKFVYRTSQLIRETYAHEVDELNTSKSKLQEIINIAPQDICRVSTNTILSKSVEFKTPIDDAFTKLVGQPRRCYVNNKRRTEQINKPKILDFTDNDTRTKIVNWLNNNQQKLDTLTQTQSILNFSDDETDFQLPSISQAPYHQKQKPFNRLRSQSLTIPTNLNEPLVKRYHSLTQGLNEDDYDIEEVHSEKLVKQVERKVLQDMLEDECLANIEQEQLVEQNKDTSKKAKGKVVAKKGKKSVNLDKSANIPNSGSSSGWDRIKDVKKTINKAAKEPKKLNINLQETNTTKRSPKGLVKESSTKKTKKSPKDSKKESPVVKATTKTTESQAASSKVDNKENETHNKKVESKLDISNEQLVHTFNLSAMENYFEKNLDKVAVLPDNNTSSDMEIDVIIDTTNKLNDSGVQNRKSYTKQINNSNNNSLDEEVFLLPTQRTPLTANQNNTLCYVAPVLKEWSDTNNIAVRLSDNLQSCISSATNLNSVLAGTLVECFTNLKTYVDKILTCRSNNKEQEMQTSQVTRHLSSKAAQTNLSPLKKLLAKSSQTPQNLLENAAVQTDIARFVDQEVQTMECLSTKRITKEKSVEKVIVQSTHYSLSSDASNKGLNNKNVTKMNKQTTYSSQTNIVGKPDDKMTTSTKTSQSSDRDNQEQHISEGSPKAGKTKSRNVSQDSFLICSVGSSSSKKSDKKINRKLTYEETQNRTFKRIRKPSSDSDSDEGGKPSKKKFVRDDLTVEFVDSERGSKGDNDAKVPSTPESEKMDYDKYLLEVMAKYGTPEKTSNEEPFRHCSQLDKSSEKKSSQVPLSSQTKKSQRSKTGLQKSQGSKTGSQKSQKNSGDHIFTAHVAFEENLEKFDKEILEYEHNSKVYSTEYDLVENTPMLSPKAKIPRLSLSNKKKDTKKHCMKEPLQILSKGSAPNSSTSKKKDPLDEESLGQFTEREPSTLNKNIENLSLPTERCADDVADILEDLRHDDDFFKSNMEIEEKEPEKIDLSQRQAKQSKVLCDDVTMADLPEDETNFGNANREALNVTQENIDEVMGNFNGFDDDDDIEAELEKISFTAEQRKLNQDRIKVLQNIKLRSQNRPVAKSALPNVIESSDVSDEEMVETTPQKTKRTSKDRSRDDLEEVENNLEFYLPPPPGFGDDVETSPLPDNDRESPHVSDDEIRTSPLPDNARESPVNDRDLQPVGAHKSSLTPDSLTDFIVTPDTMMHKEIVTSTQNDNNPSLTFKPSFFTPNKSLKGSSTPVRSTSRISQILANDPVEIFSPITRNTIKFSQTKYTPLVSTVNRLSTKKPSLMTSTPNQKSILNYVRSSQENLSASQQKIKPCIMWSRIVNKDLTVFTQLEIKKLVTTATSFNPRVTHLVVLVDEKGQIVSHTAKILIGIAAGIWVVRYEWAQDCLKLNRIVPEEPYEALDTTGVPGPQISRLTRETKPLFRGFRFYCAPPLLTIPKCDLENILQLSGGEIVKELDDMLRNDGKINIILTESSASEDTEQFETYLQIYKAVTIDVEWLTKCIGQYKLVSFRAFLVSGDDSNICDLGYPPTLVESVPFTLTEAI